MTKNNSDGKPYFTQRNNRIKPGGACNVTAMVAALSAAGWPVEQLAGDGYSQPEDALMHFILADRDVDRMWHRIDPQGKIPPNEWHPVLAFGTNLFLKQRKLIVSGKDAVVFGERYNSTMFRETLDAGGAVVVSGTFPYNGKQIGHVVAIVGYETDSKDDVSVFILDDSYGDYRDQYKTQNGNDIPMPVTEFVKLVKPCGTLVKCGHLVRKYDEAARPA